MLSPMSSMTLSPASITSDNPDHRLFSCGLLSRAERWTNVEAHRDDVREIDADAIVGKILDPQAHRPHLVVPTAAALIRLRNAAAIGSDVDMADDPISVAQCDGERQFAE